MHVVYFKQAEDHSQSLRLICLDRGLGVGKAVVNDLIDKFEVFFASNFSLFSQTFFAAARQGILRVAFHQ